ncbi:methylated-DNA--[protein]-cysteine S-methyltransferase [Hoeflea sp.]|uniref:methylated-DNA--[protein]-cysteine S-methyltransferase n=1 Tax=Hoeflea sp. TaxID=1940281 RepID=UPI003B012677
MTNQTPGADSDTVTATGGGEHVIHVETPLGPVVVTERDGHIRRLFWGRETADYPPTDETALLREAAAQLVAYFEGKRTEFDLPLTLSGNPFERRVQEQMLAIPYGETRTYGDIAKALDTYGQPVGQACGANGIPIIVPCHRVLSANGLGGFSGAGGVETKIQLLKHEGGFPFLI